MESDSCGVCGTQRQTQLHMLANCSVAATEGRYTWRHDSILFTLLQFLSQLSLYGFELYGDLDGYRRTSEIFQIFSARHRPNKEWCPICNRTYMLLRNECREIKRI